MKLGRYSRALATLKRALGGKKEELVTTISFMLLMILIASSLMYFAEHEAQPESFSSIPAAMWWSVATLTTVGYGDIYPVTVTGKILGGVIALLGVGMVALPTGILGSAFVEEIAKESREGETCPHCGRGGSAPAASSSSSPPTGDRP